MRLTDLEARLGRNISLTTAQWALAWLLGEARRASNLYRDPRFDRADTGHQSVDMHGALGELLLFGMLRELGDTAAVEHRRRQLYTPGGRRDASDPEVSFIENGTATGIDVKTFDCDPKKRFFAINDNQHQQLRGKCTGYVGLICPAFAMRACLTRIIPYANVSDWPIGALRSQGTPSRNLPIEEVMRRYCAEPYPILESRRATYAPRAVLQVALQQGPGSAADRLIRLLPALDPTVRAICDRARRRL